MAGALAFGLRDGFSRRDIALRFGSQVFLARPGNLRTWPSRLRPAALCITFGNSERIRVPRPAARTIAAISLMEGHSHQDLKIFGSSTLHATGVMKDSLPPGYICRCY